MAWPYHFVTLTAEQQLLRRHLLDRYGAYAQLSALVPILAYQLYRLANWVSSERQAITRGYQPLPNRTGSPSRKGDRVSSTGATRRLWHSLLWWLDGEVYAGWGLRGHWVAGICWASWLLFCVVHQTADDYMHVTKRFGIVAASQFPVHYMLSMKSPHFSPFSSFFGTSHEQLNAYHRVLGRIIYSFLVLHATFYMNFFIQSGLVTKRLSQLVPLLGVSAFTLLTILITTSLARVRQWSYRVFFLCHLMIAVSIPPILFYHAPPIRLYLAEGLVLLVLDLAVRKFDTVTGFSKATLIANTKLVKLVIPMPLSKIQRFQAAPGQHVYLSIPPESVPVGTSFAPLYEFLYNPFTVADVSPTDITLVLRILKGPTTTALRKLTKLSKARPGINIEGPNGDSRNFPNFARDFDRILLIAGGVGATFILPIFNQIASKTTNEDYGASKVQMIWAMRSEGEASWITETQNPQVLEDPRVKVYVTGADSENPESSMADPGPEDGSVEMGDLGKIGKPGCGRPNLRSIVDTTFLEGMEERVAVLVCGPVEMAKELREHVGRWVSKGRNVWWHDETFGW